MNASVSSMRLADATINTPRLAAVACDHEADSAFYIVGRLPMIAVLCRFS